MNFSPSERRKNKIKGAILRDIFEDNLRMAGEAGNKQKQPKRRNFVVIASLSVLLILTYVLLSQFTLLERNRSRDIQAGFFKSPVINRDSDKTFNEIGESNSSLPPPAQYNTLLNESRMPLRKIFGLKVKRIVIDPGHGGEDTGAIGKMGTNEKDITLDIAWKLRRRLKRYGEYQILMTREKDRTLSLEERVEFANSSGADLFISIHINYIPNKPLAIIETFYFGPHTDKQTLLLAEKENKGTGYTVNDFREIVRNIENTLKTQESNSLALFIQKSLYKNIHKQNKNVRDWGIKTAPFIVLLGVEIPGVLTEVTCLSNTEEEKKLNREHYREKIARYLEEGIVGYLNKNKDKGDVIWNKRSLLTKKMIYSLASISVHPAVPL